MSYPRAIEVHEGVTDEISLNKFLIHRGLEDRYAFDVRRQQLNACRDSFWKPAKPKASRKSIPTAEYMEYDRDMAIYNDILAAVKTPMPSPFLSGFQPHNADNGLAVWEAHISLG